MLSAALNQWFLSLVVGLCPFFQGPAPMGEAKKVKVTVVVILANDYWDVVNPQLVHLAEEIRKAHHNLRGFTLYSMATKSWS